MANIPECPPSLKSIQHYLKVATEHESRDPVIAYWCRLHALQVGLKATTKKTPEETKVLMALMDWLEEAKKSMKDNEAISNEVAGQAHLENYALRLFLFADKADREQNYGKNMVKAFYTAGMIYDVLTTFGDLTDEAAQNRKYAKWKAAYIHNCLKNGETPVPGPIQEGEQNEDSEATNPTPSSDPAPAAASGFPQVPGFSQVPGLPQVPGFSQVPGLPQVPGASPAPATPPSSLGSSLPDPNLAMRAASQLPNVPYTPDPAPGGFVPYDPAQQPAPASLYGDSTSAAAQLTPDQIAKAQKYCKWASSALNYEDMKTAITNLKNALELLQTGRDPA
ncbi:vacuolar protein sorting-associated protein VTA1 homolog [Cydia pomonella]|uniref:vacuolar protein sorting-associated protein VTA1 homolog n=1 Tax=Cydia pomonella TaxID=82600 RepID=UPI002ADE7E55|nr:vacuolar protein sorting-associated protein VTA1 homolog [Cydia pomonella]